MSAPDLTSAERNARFRDVYGRLRAAGLPYGGFDLRIEADGHAMILLHDSMDAWAREHARDLAACGFGVEIRNKGGEFAFVHVLDGAKWRGRVWVSEGYLPPGHPDQLRELLQLLPEEIDMAAHAGKRRARGRR